MLYKFKFRVHGGVNPGKFVFNVREGMSLYLNENFRPANGGPEFALYCLMIRKGSSTVSMLKPDSQWNAQKAERGPITLRPGHVLSTNGVSVEILDCPYAAPERREVTQFIDLNAMDQEPAPAKPAEHLITSFDISATQQPQREPAIAPVQTQPETSFDTPDTIVVPLSLDRFADMKHQETAPAPEPAPRVTPRATTPSEDPMRKREHTLKKAALVGLAFSVGIVMANFVAQRYQFDIFDDNTEPFYPRVAAVRPHHPVAPPAVAAAPVSGTDTGRAPASNVALPLPVAAETPKGPSPVDLRAFAQAIEEGKLAEVQRLVESGVVSGDFALDDLGRSPFLRAAAAGRITVMQYLISKKVAVAAADYNGNTALMWATINGHEKTVKFLLSIGADPKIKREDGKNSLQLAQQYRQPLVLKLLKSIAAAPEAKTRKPASK